MKKYIYILCCIALFATSCSQQKKEDELAKKLPELDKLAGDYRPLQADDNKSYHIAIKGKYANGIWSTDTTAVYMRPGRLPYGAASSGDIEVSYTGENGKVMGKYLIEHPGKSRSCDEGGKMRIADIFDFEILLPGTQEVKGVSLLQEGKTIQSFKVPARMVKENMRGANNNTVDTTVIKR